MGADPRRSPAATDIPVAVSPKSEVLIRLPSSVASRPRSSAPLVSANVFPRRSVGYNI